MTSIPPKDEEEILNPAAEEEKVIQEVKQITEDAPISKRGRRDQDLLTLNDLERGQTTADSEEIKWNALAVAIHKHQILTGVVSGMEEMSDGTHVAVVDYEGIRIIVPEREMVLAEWPAEQRTPLSIRIQLNKMLGATVDFRPVAIDRRNRAAIGSRKDAMRERQKHYYASGRIRPGILLSCRVIGVGNNSLVVEAAGVESVINAREVSYDWYSDIADMYGPGDLVVAKVLAVLHDDTSDQYGVKLSIKAAAENSSLQALQKLTLGSMYYGEVTGVKTGTIFVRLQAGCNAKTRLYRSDEIPSKFDTVSFKVKSIDEENGVAWGLITRIIKKHPRLR